MQEKLLAIPYNYPRIFSVKFIKRMTGEERSMLCRVGVRSHLHGGDKPYSFHQHGLIPVFDVRLKDYRSIPVETTFELKIDGKVYSTKV